MSTHIISLRGAAGNSLAKNGKMNRLDDGIRKKGIQYSSNLVQSLCLLSQINMKPPSG
jgi:hypothetical protein